MRGTVQGTVEGQSLSFGQLLREFRLAARLSQETLAERARMSVGGISVLERGTRRAPQRETLNLLAAALELSPPQRERLEDAARTAGNTRRRRTHTGEAPARQLHNLPYALTSFVGRDRESELLRARIAEHRLVTVTGAGGVGKTRLAIETAHGLVDAFADGVWLVEVARINDPELINQRIAETFGLQAGSDRSLMWMDQLAQTRALIVLDNCEHLVAACAAVAQRLLERCQFIHIVATSREPLHLTGERVFRAQPLSNASALELFVNRAQHVSAGFSIGQEDDDERRRYVRTICEELDGIPFAIELAAARVSAISLKTLADNIGERLSLLRRIDRETVPRHATMRTLIDWSYDLLTSAERQVFEALSAFGGGCTIEQASIICSNIDLPAVAVLDILTSLVDKSLVTVDFDADDARYGLLETSREYAREKLHARGEFNNVAHRHALAYLQLAQDFERSWNEAPNRNWHARARTELENWRIAMQWSLGDRHDVILGQRLTGALQPVWITFALSEGRRWCNDALGLVDETTPADVRAALEYARAIISLVGGEVAVALQASEEASADFQQIGDARGTVKAETVAGRALLELGQHDAAECRLSNALEGARAAGDSLLAAVTQLGLGLSRSIAGDLEGSLAHVHEACDTAHALSADRIALVAMMVAVEAYLQAGETDAAIAIAERAVLAARDIGDDFAVMRTLSNLAGSLVAGSRYDEATRAAREALGFRYVAQGATTLLWALQHLAAAAALASGADIDEQRLARVARILGFVDAQLALLGARGDVSEQCERARLQPVLEAALQSNVLARNVSIGKSLTQAQAVEQSLAL